MTFHEIKTQYPFPWASLIDAGLVRVIDSGGHDVPLLTIVELAKIVTAIPIKKD